MHILDFKTSNFERCFLPFYCDIKQMVDMAPPDVGPARVRRVMSSSTVHTKLLMQGEKNSKLPIYYLNANEILKRAGTTQSHIKVASLGCARGLSS